MDRKDSILAKVDNGELKIVKSGDGNYELVPNKPMTANEAKELVEKVKSTKKDINRAVGTILAVIRSRAEKGETHADFDSCYFRLDLDAITEELERLGYRVAAKTFSHKQFVYDKEYVNVTNYGYEVSWK